MNSKQVMTNSKNMCKNWLWGIPSKERIYDSENTGQFLGESGIWPRLWKKRKILLANENRAEDKGDSKGEKSHGKVVNKEENRKISDHGTLWESVITQHKVGKIKAGGGHSSKRQVKLGLNLSITERHLKVLLLKIKKSLYFSLLITLIVHVHCTKNTRQRKEKNKNQLYIICKPNSFLKISIDHIIFWYLPCSRRFYYA